MAESNSTQVEAREQRMRIVAAAYLAGEEAAPIADRLGVSVGTVYSDLKRAGVNARPKWRKTTLEVRFRRMLSERTESGCILWTGSTCRRGYGIVGVGGRKAGVASSHRVAWMLTNGPIPDGLFVCHRCDNPPCVNPDHLFLGTNQDNVDDMVAKGRNRKGVASGNAKLDDEQVREIRRLFGSGECTLAELSERFGVCPMVAWRAAKGKTWKHVD